MSILGRIVNSILPKVVEDIISPTDGQLPWILSNGTWNDDNFWIDTEFWNDGVDWILESNSWDDSGAWKDTETWND